jgi:hypothetical protein
MYSPPVVWDDVVNDPSALAAHLTDMDDLVSQLWDAMMGNRMTEEFHQELRLGRPKQGAPPLARRAGGRSPKGFVMKLAAFGGAWLAANGIPENQADLVRALEAQCDQRGWDYGSTQVREMATELIAHFQDQLKS